MSRSSATNHFKFYYELKQSNNKMFNKNFLCNYNGVRAFEVFRSTSQGSEYDAVLCARVIQSSDYV